MAQHIPGAERAAEKIAFRVWPEERGFTKKDSWISQKVVEFTAIIDEETAAPDLQAKIDRLEAEKAELVTLLKRLDAWDKACPTISKPWKPPSMESILEDTRAALAKKDDNNETPP